MKFWIWFIIAIVLVIAVVPVIMMTAWKLAGYLIMIMIFIIFYFVWRFRQDRRKFF